MKYIVIPGGLNYGKTERLRAWLAISRRLGEECNLALFGNVEGVADLPVLGAAEAAAYEDPEEETDMTRPGAAFAQWFATHDIPSLVARYTK